MTGALLILGVTVLTGIILYFWEHYRSKRHGASLHHSPQQETGVVCCGMHAICEKTGAFITPPEYYDDEELDRFAGRSADDYTEEETEEFRDILLTLAQSDAPGWAISLQKRNITLPASVKPELDLMLQES